MKVDDGKQTWWTLHMWEKTKQKKQTKKQKKKKNKKKNISLSHIILASLFGGIGKQCIPRPDTAERGVWSGFTLLHSRISIKK